MEQQVIDSAVPAADPAMRQLFLGLIIAAPLVGLLPMAWSWRQLSGFLGQVRRLATDQDLNKLKALVRWQMYGALVQIGVLLTPMALMFLGIFLGALGLGDSLIPIGSFMVVLVGGMALRSLERRVQSIPCETPELEKARDAVVHTWLKKPLPDWED